MFGRRQPKPKNAVTVFERFLAERKTSRDSLTAVAALEAWLAFERVIFRVSEESESDGFLYQYGTYRFTGEPRFHLDLTRQFALPGEDEYLQFHCDVQFAPRPELLALGAYNEWWFRDSGGDFAKWGSSLLARPEWSVLKERQPLTVELSLMGT